MTTKTQQDFEKWLTDTQDYAPEEFFKYETGGHKYQSGITQQEWELWVFARKHALEDVLKLANDPKTNYCNLDFFELKQAIKELLND